MAPKTFSSGLVTLSRSIILPCLALSSALELALKNAAPTRPDNWNALVTRAISVVWWPQNMFPNEAGILNASSALALVTTFVVSVLAIYARRKGPAGTAKTRLGVLLVVALNAVLALVAFLYAFIQSKVSERVDVSYLEELYDTAMASGEFLYEKGTFTSEMFACSIDDFIMDEFDGEMKKACAMHMGARWLTLTTFFFSAALLAVLFVDSRREGHILHSSKSFYSSS